LRIKIYIDVHVVILHVDILTTMYMYELILHVHMVLHVYLQELTLHVFT
jgi:hypothetical protein